MFGCFGENILLLCYTVYILFTNVGRKKIFQENMLKRRQKRKYKMQNENDKEKQYKNRQFS